MRSFIISTVCISAFLISGADQVFSQDSWNMELIGKAAYDGELDNYLAYNGNLYIDTQKPNPSREFFTVVDISDPSLPDRVRISYEGLLIGDFIIVDSLLYMSIEYGGVVIYDIQNPSLPVELTRLEDNRGFSSFMRLYNGYIISAGWGGLNVIDISNRLDPQIANIIVVEYGFMDLDFFNDYLILAEVYDYYRPHFLEIIDISDIFNPTQIYFAMIDSTELYYTATLKVVGSYFYLCKQYIEGIQIYDINDPGEPQLVNTVFDDMVIADMVVSDDVLFAARNYDAILTMDISDPLNPVITNEFLARSVGDYFGTGRNLCLSGDNLYFMAAKDVISFLDVTDPNSPQLQGRYFPGTIAYSVAKRDNYAYFGRHIGGIRIVDISDPLEPIGVSCFGLSGSRPKVIIEDGILFITDALEGVRIFALDDPLSPELLSTISTTSRAWEVYAAGNMLYIAKTDGFSIIDVSDPGNPYEIGYYESLQMRNQYHAIISHGDFVYAAESDSGIGVYDITDPSTPIKVGIYSNTRAPSGLFYRESILYVSDCGRGFLIIDVSDPSNPSLMGNAECGIADDVFVEGNRAYIADRGGAFKVFDISNPYSPELIATYDDFGFGKGVYVEDDTAYVAAGDGGLWILRYTETVGIEDEAIKPGEFQLDQNHPNPFNAKTVLNYSLPESGVVTLSIYNILGQQVMTLFAGEKAAGKHTIAWDASDFPSGVYFARLETQDVSKTIKMVLLK